MICEESINKKVDLFNKGFEKLNLDFIKNVQKNHKLFANHCTDYFVSMSLQFNVSCCKRRVNMLRILSWSNLIPDAVQLPHESSHWWSQYDSVR